MVRRILTNKERAAIQQPLDKKTGYSNSDFDKLYGKENNPYIGTERDRNMRKSGGNVPMGGNNSMGKCDKCDAVATVSSIKNGQVEYQLCKKCFNERCKRK